MTLHKGHTGNKSGYIVLGLVFPPVQKALPSRFGSEPLSPRAQPHRVAFFILKSRLGATLPEIDFQSITVRINAKVGIYIYIEEITNIEMSLTNIIS